MFERDKNENECVFPMFLCFYRSKFVFVVANVNLSIILVLFQ